VLRKDFIIDDIQIAEAAMAGADAILIIVAAVNEQTKALLNCAKTFGLEALIEVHNQQELELALSSGAEIIGINNRNLQTLQVDTEQALKLIDNIPREIVRVAESGILAPELARDYYRAGFDAILIGEALVKSEQPEKFMKACRG
jgi:indole-3-glycerol phosphate synthase